MKLLKIFGYACGGIIGVIVLVWFCFGPHQPNDGLLAVRFYRHRSDLEFLVSMMDEDRQMSRIAPDFTWRQDNCAWPRPEPEWGISRARWDEYRGIFSRAGVQDGTTRREKSSDVLIYVWSWGIVPAGVEVSYLHCGQPRNGYTNTEIPCLEKRYAGSGMFGNSTSDGYRYKKITEDWYIYEEYN